MKVGEGISGVARCKLGWERRHGGTKEVEVLLTKLEIYQVRKLWAPAQQHPIMDQESPTSLRSHWQVMVAGSVV